MLMGITFLDRRLFDYDGSIVHKSPASGFFKVCSLFCFFFLSFFPFFFPHPLSFVHFFPLVRIGVCIGNWLFSLLLFCTKSKGYLN